MTVQGLRRVTAAIQTVRRKGLKGLHRGLYRGGLFLQRESQKLVPIDTGALRNSANTRREGGGTRPAVVVSYSTEYAVFVHENLEARHKPGRQAKYLEQPLRDKRDRIQEIVVEAMRDAMP